MRRLFLILLVTLLPLRGWAVDNMALQTAKHGTVVVSAHCAEMLADAKSVAESVAESVTPDTGSEADNAATPSMTCSQCQLCHILGLAVSVVMPVASPLPQVPLAQAAPRFVSATLASSFKPPRV